MRRPARTIMLAVVAATLAIPGNVAARGGSPAIESSARPNPVTPRRIGNISIPKLNVSQPIYSGVTEKVFDIGIGYWPGTALPGQEGNMVLGGHRTSGARPFYDIQKLAVGDPIIITRGGRKYTYVVNGFRIVKPTATWILNQTSARTLTMFSCHPRGSIRQRYVVTASLQS